MNKMFVPYFLAKTVLFLALTIFSSLSIAEERSVLFTAGIGFTNGGDTLSKVQLVDQNNKSSTESVKAGGETHYWIGAIFLVSDTVGIQTTIGRHEDTVSAENGKIKFTRNVVDAIALYSIAESWRLGGGLTYHLSPEYSGSGFGASPTIEFDDALGLTLDVGYLFSKSFAMDARYVDIEYDVPGFPKSIDGSHYGLYVSFMY